jgi:hypothetical protein
MKTRLTYRPGIAAPPANQPEPAAYRSALTPRRPRSRTSRRRIATAITLALATAGTGLVMAGPAMASWYPATVGASGVNVRDCYHPTVKLPPSTNCTYLTTLSPGTSVNIVCQRTGQNIGGDNVWDYVVYSGGQGLAADYYINTGYPSWIPGIDTCQ